jgi:hypothetical protein
VPPRVERARAKDGIVSVRRPRRDVRSRLPQGGGLRLTTRVANRVGAIRATGRAAAAGSIRPRPGAASLVIRLGGWHVTGLAANMVEEGG